MVTTVKVNPHETGIKPQQGGQLEIQALLQNLDVDGDGDIDEEDKKIGEALKQMDMDGDGMISIRELVNIGKVKVGDEKKMANMKKYMIVGAVVSLLFIALSLCATIAAIELTKESRNKDSVMTDAASGKPVATAPVTGGVDATTGKKDTSVRDSDGNVAASGVARGSTVLSSRTLTVETAKAITELTLPVTVDGKSLTISVTVTGFELAPDGSKCMFYTASGGMVLVVDEDITVYKRSITGTIRTMKADAARPATRRAAARRLSKLRRSLLQINNSTFIGNSTGGNGFSDCPPGAACASGPCTGDLCSPPVCMEGKEYNPATQECECPPGMSLVEDAWGYSYCKCEDDTVESWIMDENYMSHRICLPCPGGAIATTDGYSCYDCDSANGIDRIWQHGMPDTVAGGTNSGTGPPAFAGFCKGCPPGMHREVDDQGYGYVYEFCACDNPCMVTEWDMTTDTEVCKTCSYGNAIHSPYGRWCGDSISPDYNEVWCFDIDGTGSSDETTCASPMVLDPTTSTCMTPTSTTCMAPMVWDSLTMSCMAMPNTPTCVDPMAYDPMTMTCTQPTVTCQPPQVYDAVTFVCVTPVTCVPPMVYDSGTSTCMTPAVTCALPMVMDANVTCVTPTTTCLAPQTYDPATLTCILPTTTVTCALPMVYNTMTMDCVQPNTNCIAPTVFDPATDTCVSCVPPMAYNYTTEVCMPAPPTSSCVAPMVFNSMTGTCT